MKKEFKVPKFKSEDEERVFWINLDLSEYLLQEDFLGIAFPNLKPTSGLT